MRYLVAVSGGVDSVVLLHKLASEAKHEIVVAHFDHGIRPESDADARFVEGLAKQYGFIFETRREELGAEASEALARERRYLFLRDMAEKHKATIATAHHGDDLIETIAINLIRGTGWRGLAVLDSPDIERPLLKLTKHDIYQYALQYDLEWVEDETNTSDAYLRNRVRRQLGTLIDASVKKVIWELRQQQLKLKHDITIEEDTLLGEGSPYSRYLFTHIDTMMATELLRVITKRGITRPQAERALHAIKTAKPGSISEVGAGIRLVFSTRHFTIQTP